MNSKYCAGQIFYIEHRHESHWTIYIQNRHKQEDYLVHINHNHNLKIGDFVVANIDNEIENSHVVKIFDLI